MPYSGTAVSRGARVRLDEDRARTDIVRPTASTEVPYDPRYEADSPWGQNWATGERRTVQIRGRGSERYAPSPRSASARRRTERRHERASFKADRAAMWAVLLGVMLMLAAVTSAHAATLHTLAH